MLTPREKQNYLSAYNDIREWFNKQQHDTQNSIDWSDVVFEVELLKSQEINLDYIVGLIYEKNQQQEDKTSLIDDIRKTIRANLSHRAKESLLVDFIEQNDLSKWQKKEDLIEAFYAFARKECLQQLNTLIQEERLNQEATKRYIATALKRGYASESGTALNDTLPKISPLHPDYRHKKQNVFEKIALFVERFTGIGSIL